MLMLIRGVALLAAIISTARSQCFNCDVVTIDADTGGDDAMALSMILGSSKAQNLIGITTIAGNTDVANATKNTKYILNVFNKLNKIPVYEGTDDGMISKINPTFYYGYDGFGDFLPPLGKNPPPPAPMTPRPAVFLADLVERMPNKVTTIFLGPLTNLALAMHLNPKFMDQVKEIVILGGSYEGRGNQVPGAEANFYGDPEAAAYVFNKSTNKKVTLIPMETIQRAAFTMEYRKEKLGKINSAIMKLLNKVENVSMKKDGSMWPPYDMAAVAYYINPNVSVSTLETYIQVETSGRYSRGSVITDFTNLLKRNSNVKIITSLNQTLLSNILIKTLS